MRRGGPTLTADLEAGNIRANPEAQAFENSFAGWKDIFVIDLPNGSLVKDVDKYNPSQEIVHSEGLAYGLYFAVMAEDRATFDKLLNGAENYMRNENGLYAWKLNTRGEILENQSAADGDIYAAAAVTLAYAKWKDPRYQAVADRLINAIWEKEVLWDYKGYTVILPSDGKWPRWGDGRFVYDPSYITPSLFRIFAAVDHNPGHDWGKLIDDGYTLLGTIINNADKLGHRGINPIPDWVLGNILNHNFTLFPYTRTPDQELDAVRVYLELARDAAVSKDPRAQTSADRILNKIPPIPTPQTVEVRGLTPEAAQAYYGLLYLASSRINAIGQTFIANVRPAYQNKFIGRTESDRQHYYMQSLMLHAAAILGGYTYQPGDLSGLLPARDYDKYVPYQIYAKDDGAVYVNQTLIYRYTVAYKGKNPYQRAQASVEALQQTYLDDHLRPKYVGKESDSHRGAMIANYYFGFKEATLFELGPQDFGKPEETSLGYGKISWAYRWAVGTSYEEEILGVKPEDDNWMDTAAQFVGIKARKNSLEWQWDQAYATIYQKLVESRIISFRSEAEKEIEDPSALESISRHLVDYYTLTNDCRSIHARI